VFVAAAVAAPTDWGTVARNIVPNIPHDLSPAQLAVYGYFVVGIMSSIMMPYELIFYSSGAVEEKWRLKEKLTNRAVTVFGFGLAAIIAITLISNSAALLAPRGIDPQLLGATALQAIIPFGFWGMVLVLLGMGFAITGAAIETALSSAYMCCQFFNLPWSKNKPLKEAPLFYAIWMGIVVMSALAAIMGPEPMQVVEYAVIFSVLALPLTNLVILMAANDRDIMREHTNGVLANALGTMYLALSVVLAIAAIPLMILTSTGEIW
jgi:Mn2+/Fe2+ NRAMP family transporter